MNSWNSVKKEDVIKAIQIFNEVTPSYKKPSSTYLVYDDIVYPGKQIRRMSFEVAFVIEPKPQEIRGGRPTIKFFENLGFDTYWTQRDDPVIKYERQIAIMKTCRK